MAFDAGMFAASVWEINSRAADSRVEKVCQPEKEEVVLLLRTKTDNLRLSLRAGSNSPRVGITAVSKENPEKAPMFCMLLRKHLGGAHFSGARQQGFERAAEFLFDSHDELGFACQKALIIEIMGTYSNIILLDQDRKILGALKTVDLTDRSGRAVLPGIQYQNPPLQNKMNPLEASREDFFAAFAAADGQIPADKFIMSRYMGISALLARELSYSCARTSDAPLGSLDAEQLWFHFSALFEGIRARRFRPSMICSREGKPIEYTFIPIRQYGNSAVVRECESFAALTDEYFGTREQLEHMKQRSSDLLRLLTSADTRLRKKIALQTEELEATKDAETLRQYGDLITSNIHAIRRGAGEVTLQNFYADECTDVTIRLDERMTPAQNAQRYYKKYAKLKVAKVELTKQLSAAHEELAYIDTVFDALTRAATENDLADIRAELYESGFASKMKTRPKKKKTPSAPLEYRSSGGYRILCGKNNVQNDLLTTKTAARQDYWFHVKNAAGSHVILLCDGKEPPERDMTEAAEIAAYNSKSRGGNNIAVDYTRVYHVKKPGGAKPGFVIYLTNSTAFVSPEPEKINAMLIK